MLGMHVLCVSEIITLLFQLKLYAQNMLIFILRSLIACIYASNIYFRLRLCLNLDILNLGQIMTLTPKFGGTRLH